jgi:protein-S-isoprenylcysteine O-methyltransferase Ste14
MNRNMNEYLPAILNIVTVVGVLLISFLVELRFPMPKGMAKFLGLFIVYAGMALVIWAAVHIKGALAGMVEPRLDVLVRDGPYRFVRHPVYLGMTIALVGTAVALRSWLGLIGVFLLFLPTEIYRARLEEKALARKFGSEWENYAAQTGFILPFIGKG